MPPYNRQDRFFKKAKQEKFAARSVYKLEEIDRRFRIFRPQARIVDLGCAPGSWLQYIASRVGPRGAVVGYDLAPVMVSAGPQVRVFEVDVQALTVEEVRTALAALVGAGAGAGSSEGPLVEARAIQVDALVSDMAPKLSGINDADQARSIGLAEKALELAEPLVKQGGTFIAKVFQGRDTDAFLVRVKALFGDVKLLKLEATREGSREAFIVARERRGSPAPRPSDHSSGS